MYKKRNAKNMFAHINEEKKFDRIKKAKQKLGKALIILGHHYQRDEIIQFADFRGDSLELSKRASQEKEARYIVFCGVHFMAETADILSQPRQTIFLPNLNARCPMAAMAEINQVSEAWDNLSEIAPEIIPITYINSTAEIKAFCGKHRGLVSTSSNTEKAFRWVLARHKKIFFFPDEHLGINTVTKLSINQEEIII